MNRRASALLIVGILALQLILISDQLRPSSASKLKKKLRKIGTLLLLLKSKKPKFGLLPIPVPVPVPMKIEKPESPVIVHKKSYPVPVHHAVPVHEPYPEPYPVVEAPTYVDGGYLDSGYGGGDYGGGHGGGYDGGY